MTFGEYFQSVMSDLLTTHEWDDPYFSITPGHHDGRWIDMIYDGYATDESVATTAAVINANSVRCGYIESTPQESPQEPVMTKPKFDRDQLIFIAETALTSAWDRIDSFLPSCERDIEDFNLHKTIRLNCIHGAKCVIAAFFPILYAQLTGDGMGIGDFPEYDLFEAEVEEYIRIKTTSDGADAAMHPDSKELAVKIVDNHYQDYLWDQVF